jgi:hypothetical protein
MGDEWRTELDPFVHNAQRDTLISRKGEQTGREIT